MVNIIWQTTPEPDSKEAEEKKKKNKFAGFLRFWDQMQSTICGHKPARKDKPQSGNQDPEHGMNGTDVGNGTDVHPDVVIHRRKRSLDGSMDEIDLSK